MSNKISNKSQQEIVAQYCNDTSATELCIQYGVPRSTLYFWIKQFRIIQAPKLTGESQSAITYRDYAALRRRVAKQEAMLAVIKASGCSLLAPLKEKLIALEKLYGQYDVHTLCEALDVSRGTFYNHIFRRKSVTWHDQRREEIRVQVNSIFEESKRRFGAKKVCAVLQDRGVRTTPYYVG